MNQPADIRRFLMTFFSDEELDTLCFDHFPAVRANFTVGMTKEQRVKLLLDHCRQHGRFQTLYDALARERPEQWSGLWAIVPGAPGPLIFLSYAWGDDKPFVERLHADLEAAGFDVWRDETDMPSRGADLDDEILLAIDRCHRFVPVVGPRAFERPVVVAEWAYARRMGKAITPVWRLGEAMPPDFARKLYFDFRDGRPGYDYALTLAALRRRLAQAELPPGPLETIGVFPELPEGVIERREYERLVAALWRDPGGGAAAITGRAGMLHAPGGLGKTTLAALFAQDWDTRRHFRDGVWWIGVGRDADVLALLREFGRRLGEEDTVLQQEYGDVARGRARLQILLGERQSLIVLDDVWDGDHARAFFAPAPRCRWLITTRARNLGGDLGLAPGRVIPLDYLTETEGVRLIVGVLGAHVKAEDTPLYAKIAGVLGGHTQAIAIAAARLNPDSDRYLPPDRLLERYQKRQEGPDPFADLVLSGEEREKNLERSLWESYDALPDDADRRRFRLLGAFAAEGGFDVAAVMGVWQDDREAAEDGLARLVARSLLSRAGDGRYGQHALLRAYALAWLKREGEEGAARERHFGYYAEAYSDHDRNWASEDRTWHNQIGADFDNIQYALEWGLAEEPGVACRLIDALEDTYVAYRHPAETRQELLAQAKDAAIRAGNRQVEANTLKALGDVHLQLAEYEAARAKYEAARLIYAGIGDRLGEANTLKSLGDVHLRLAEYEAARAKYEAARPIYAGIGARLGEANTIKSLGDVHRMLAEYEAARAKYEAARPIYAGIGDRLGEANTLQALGDVHLRLAEYEAARAKYEAARPIYAGIGARLGEANTLQSLGDVHYMLDEYEAARAKYEEARPIYAGIGARLGEANTIKSLGDVHLQLAEYEAARAKYEEARPIYAGIGARLGEANTLKSLGDVHLRLAEYEAARAKYEAARPIYAGIGDRLGEANTLQALGDVHLRLAEYEAARAKYEEARPIYAGIGARLGEANTLKALGDVHLRLAEYEAARAKYEAARPIYAEIGDKVGQANVAYSIARLYLLGDDQLAAEGFLAEAVAIGNVILPGHPVVRGWAEQLAALRAELSAAGPPPAGQD